MRAANIVRFSYLKFCHSESIKIIRLYLISDVGVWVKRFNKGVKMLLMNHSNARVVQYFDLAKRMMVSVYTFISVKNGSAQCFPIINTIHG